MNRRVLPLLVLMVAPIAAADFVHEGTMASSQAHAPQMHCEFLQTEAHPRSDPLACDVQGAIQRAHILRIRLLGPGRVYAFLYDEVRQTQIIQTDCVSTLTTPVATCIRPLQSNGFELTAPRVRLHAFLDGPGGAAATVAVERVQYSLP